MPLPTSTTAPPAAAATTGPDGGLRARADAVLERLTARPGEQPAEAVAFREGQWEAVEALVARHERALVVQRTGWGKSAVYFVATALLRERGAGPTLLVSPLLALMRDQIAAAERAGVRAAQISSSNATEWAEVTASVQRDEVDVLLVSPERLTNPAFAAQVLPGLVEHCGLLVVDEAHCISDWGHDFRPDYRRIAALLTRLPAGTPVLATTATANARVVQDVAEQLGSGAEGAVPVTTVRGPLGRTSLRLGVLTLPGADARLGWLAAHLDDLPGSGIVYTLTVSAAEDTAQVLRAAGHPVLAYTGRTDDAERRVAEEALRSNQVKAVVATSALGMGFDKPDLGFVVHLGAPSSPVSYYQQIGRAGRAVASADVLLLPGREDADIWAYFATASMPRRADADAVLSALADAARTPNPALSTAALETAVDLKRTRLELLLKVLAVDGAVERAGSGWRSTGRAWTYDEERYQRVARAREDEADAMRAYQRAAGDDARCRMQFLQESLDDETAAPCGRCDVCAGPWYPVDVPVEHRTRAGGVLRSAGVEVEPRRMWPTGMKRLGVEVAGKIPVAQQAAPGRAVARLTDLGWGGPLRRLFADSTPDAPVPADLVDACLDVLKGWGWAERPVAVTSVPSRRRPQLVASVAGAIAGIGRLPLLPPLSLVRGGPTSGPGGNSAYRLAGTWERFEAGPELAEALAGLSGGPVLLVDDLADSRWTLTVAARALRRAGSGEVMPLVLALAG